MRPAEALDQVRAALGQEGFTEAPGDHPTFEGSVAVGARRLRVSVAFPCLRFTRLPVARLLCRQEELPGTRAHVERDDRLCYAAPGSIVLDMYEPGNSALTVLACIRETLQAVLDGSAEAELSAEFPQHWMGGSVHVALAQGAEDGAAFLLATERLGAPPLTVLTRCAERGSGFVGGAMGRIDGHPFARAWLCRTDRPLRLEAGAERPDNYSTFLDSAGAVDPTLPGRLMRAAREQFFREHVYLFVAAPNGCVGARLIPPVLWERACRRRAFWADMLDEKASAIGLELLSGTRMDSELARRRNLGGGPSLAGRNIVLVGCGTIGGHLARFLVQSGAGDGGRLLVFDNGTLAVGNLGRHLLGPGDIASNKALAIEREISRHFPHANVQGVAESVLDRIEVAARADLLIDATGEEALSRTLNHEVLLRRPGGPAAIFAWLVGQGAAAQALYVPNHADGRGCLACHRPYGAAASVARPGVSWRMVPAACGEASFMPYGVAAPAIAAGLAARMAVEWAAGDVRPSLRTVRVDHASTSEIADADVSRRSGCPACGAGPSA